MQQSEFETKQKNEVWMIKQKKQAKPIFLLFHFSFLTFLYKKYVQKTYIYIYIDKHSCTHAIKVKPVSWAVLRTVWKCWWFFWTRLWHHWSQMSKERSLLSWRNQGSSLPRDGIEPKEHIQYSINQSFFILSFYIAAGEFHTFQLPLNYLVVQFDQRNQDS